MTVIHTFRMKALFLFSFAFFARDLFAGDATIGEHITLWTRAAGLHSDGRDPGRIKPMDFDLTKHNMKVVKLADFQYGGRFEYKAVKLLDVIESYHPKVETDRILLHFKNGMIIPMPTTNGYADLKKNAAWIAVSWRLIKLEGHKSELWQNRFDDIGRIDERFRDPAPVTFGYNKLVMKSGWHPYVSDEVFTPFRHADTLIGIEFVSGQAYDRQYVSDKNTEGRKGWQVYFERCQYCHALNKTGPTHGWDFLDPVPIYELKTPENLLYRVKYSFHNAMAMGMQMPRQESVDLQEVTDLWNWLKSFEKVKINAYKP
jgi:hypothetical protein